jgi:hypothetical protein
MSRCDISCVSVDRRKDGRGVGVGQHGRRPSSSLNGVVAGKFGDRASSLFVEGLGNVASLPVILVPQSEDSLVRTALWVAEVVAVAFVDDLLENTLVPAVKEISVVSVPSAIAICEDERLVGVHGLGANVVEVSSAPVDLEENTGNFYRELGILAVTLVGTLRAISDMRLVVRRISVLSVPAAGKVDLGTDTGRAFLVREFVVLGSDTVEIETQIGYC